MTDTTIGYAVLQIIPSLKGVSEAIDKEIGGQVVAVTIEPKTDAAKVDKSVRDAVKKSKPPEVQLEPKVDPSKIDKAVKDSAKKAKPPEIKIEPKIDAAETRGVADELKDIIVDAIEDAGYSVDELVDAAAKKLGRKVGEIIGDSPIGDLARGVADKVGGIVEKVQPAIDHVRDAIDGLRSHDAAGTLGGIAGALRDIGQSGAADTVDRVGREAGEAQGSFNQLRDNIKGTTTSALELTNNSGKIAGGLNTIAAAAGPLAATFVALDKLMPGFDQHLQSIMKDGGSFKDWVNVALPGTNLIDKFWLQNQPSGGLPPVVPNKPTTLGGAPRPGTQSGPGLPPGWEIGPGGIPIKKKALGGLAGYAGGGVADVINGLIRGPGTGTSDSILGWPAMVRVSNQEFITNAADTAANLPLLQAVNSGVPLWEWMKNMPRFDTGGLVDGPDVSAARSMAGTPYDQATRHDCSGMAARVIDRALGLPEVGLMSTKNAAEWLAARGFKPGLGGPGQISVGWYDHGPNPNDGHMAMTLSNGLNAESGGKNGVFTIGGTAAGARDPQFDHHMYLPTVYGEGPAGSSSPAAPLVGGGGAPGGAPILASNTGGGSSSLGGFSGSSISLPSSLSGFGSFAGQQLGQLGQLGDLAGMGDLGGLGDLGQLGSAAGSFIDGQVASALDLFGVPSTPGWLKGITNFISGISIGGGGGAALPTAANPTSMGGTNPPGGAGSMNGGAGQPGVVNNWTINARDTEDAFVRAQRIEKEKSAAKLDRF